MRARWLMGALYVAALAGLGAPRAAAQISPGPLARPHQQLEGARQCVSCHAVTSRDSMPARCTACHRDIAWLAAQGRGVHGRLAGRSCASCHPDHAGRDFALIQWPEGAAERFDHRRAGWTLEGRHAELACAKCHTAEYRRSAAAALAKAGGTSPRWTGLETSCAGCHVDPHRGALTGGCLKCHDLHGWKPAPKFDHTATAYPLTGRHRDVACEKCHLDPKLHPARTPAGEPVPIYRPVPHPQCSTCHQDPHRGALGMQCSGCHVTAAFTQVDRRRFDHDRTRYPLRGRHAAVACAACHTTPPGRGVRLAFATCTSCHADPHAGTATIAGQPADCASCHDVQGFRPTMYTAARHATAPYPLEGRHRTVPCASCHPTNPPGMPAVRLGKAGIQLRPAAAQCADCHTDPYAGRFAANGPRAEPRGCAGCHTVQDFRPSLVDVAAHERYAFALEGAHRAVPCGACHRELAHGGSGRRSDSTVTFTIARHACADCHTDVHDGQFASRPGGGTCETCHRIDAFHPASGFDHDRDTRFALRGGHAGVPCGRCHVPTPNAAGKPVIRYTATPTQCERCHDARKP